MKTEGIPFLKVMNINEFGFKTKNIDYIDLKTHNVMKRSQLHGNEILYSMAGTIGIAVNYNHKFKYANINQAISKILLKDISKNQLIVYLLNSNLCKLQSKRFLTVSAQPNINFEQIKSIKIPNLSENQEINILDTMDNAYKVKKQKEQESKNLFNDIDNYLLDKLGITLPDEPENNIENRTFKVGFDDIFNDRLDANSYTAYYQNIFKVLETTIVTSCDYIAKKIKKDDIDTMPVFFDILISIVNNESIKNLIIIFIKKENLYILINIIFYISIIKNNTIDDSIKEICYFYDWLKNYAKLTKFSEFENLYKTYKETYIPQDYKIFVAMEFYQQDNVYKAIKGTIEKVAKDMNLPLECIRIDKVEKGNTYQIMDEILKQIQDNRLLIADITNKNPNVYLEVGYAMGLAKSRGIENQIMFFLKIDEDAKVGFDLQSYQQNRYKDTEELREKLESQLKVYYGKLII